MEDDIKLINSVWRHIRTRLYFTSASHLYALMNIIKHFFWHKFDEKSRKILDNIKSLSYLS